MPKIYALDRQNSIVIAAADYFEDLSSFRQSVFNSNLDLFSLNSVSHKIYNISSTSMLRFGEIDIDVLLFDEELNSLDGQYLFEIEFLNNQQKLAFLEAHNIELLNCLKLSARQRDMQSYDQELNRKNSFVQDNRTIAEILGLNVNDPWDRRDELQKLRDQDADKRMRENMSKGLISSDSSFTMPNRGGLVKEVEMRDGKIVSATAHIGERKISQELRESLLRDNERKLRAAGLQSEIIDENWNRSRINKLIKFFNEELQLFNHKPLDPKIVENPQQVQEDYIQEHNLSIKEYQNLDDIVFRIRNLSSGQEKIGILAIDYNHVDLFNASGAFVQNIGLGVAIMAQTIFNCLSKKLQKDMKLAKIVIIKNSLVLITHQDIVYENDLDISSTTKSQLEDSIKANKDVGEQIEKIIQELGKNPLPEVDNSDLKTINKIEAMRDALQAKGCRQVEPQDNTLDDFDDELDTEQYMEYDEED